MPSTLLIFLAPLCKFASLALCRFELLVFVLSPAFPRDAALKCSTCPIRSADALFSAPGFNAFDYMLLGRMIHFYLPSRSIFGIRATSLTKIFVFFDVAAFIVQAVGGSMASSGPGESQSAIDLGLHIYMGGIGFQQLAILVFSAMAIQLRVQLLQLEKNGTLAEVGKEKGWRKLLYSLYASLICITVSPSPLGLLIR